MASASIRLVLGQGDRLGASVLAMAQLRLGRPHRVDTARVLDDPGASLAEIDLVRQRATFVIVDDGRAARRHPFLYEAQRDRARAVAELELSELLALAERAAPSHAPILCYSTARSGSTLLVQALDRIPGIWGVSEPDVFTQLAEHAAFRSDRRAVPIVRACESLLFGTSRPPRRFALKFRTQVTALSPLLRRTWPDAPAVFSSRPLVPSIESFAQAFVSPRRWRIMNSTWFRPWLHLRIPRDGFGIPTELWPPPGPPPARELAELGAAYQAVAYWLAATGWAAWLRGQGALLFALDFRELLARPLDTMATLLQHCGEDPALASASLPAFAIDSQRDAGCVRRRTATPRLDARQIATLQAFVTRHARTYGVA